MGIAALLAAGVAAGAAAAAARPPPILFTSDRPDYDLVALRLDDGAHVRLTRGFAQDFQPSWSTDGRRIAFTRDGKVAVLDLASKRVRVLASGQDPDWSPDGPRITFTCSQDRWCEIRRDGTHFREHSGGDEPAWSPDGQLLAVTSFAGRGLRLVRPDGGVVRTLVRYPHGRRDIGYGEEQEPDFSPDGRWLVLTRDAGHKPSLYAVGTAGGGARLSPDRHTEEDGGAWAPGGRRIAFRLRDGNRCFLAVRWSATGRTRRLALVSGLASCFDRPEWTRDGRGIVYSSVRDLWSIPSGGGRPVRLTITPTAAEFAPRFAPDGTSLGYEDARGVWLLPAGGTPHLLVPGARAFAWSHRDGRLAYVDMLAALIVRSSTGEETTILSGLGSPNTGDVIADPSWSPDDRRIAFTLPPDPAERYGLPTVAVVDVATGRLHVVAGSGDQWGSRSPDWRS